MSEPDFAAEYLWAIQRVQAMSGGASVYEDALIDAVTDAVLEARAAYDPTRGLSWRQWARLCIYRRLAGVGAPDPRCAAAGDMGATPARPAPALESLGAPPGSLTHDLVERVVLYGDSAEDAARACGVDATTARTKLRALANRVRRERRGS